MSISIKNEAKDAFDCLKDQRIIQGIQEIVGCYHYRNGKKHNDGSRGEIRLSPKEFRDLLAYMSGALDAEAPVVNDPIGETNYEAISNDSAGVFDAGSGD